MVESRMQSRFFQTLIIALLAVCAWALVRVAMLLLTSAPTLNTQAVTVADSARWQWFGDMRAQPAAAAKERDAKVDDISLDGIAMARGSRVAVVRVGARPARVFRSGDELRRGVSIAEILNDRIVLAAGLGEVALPRAGSAKPVPAAAAPRSSNAALANLPDDLLKDIGLEPGDALLAVEGMTIAELSADRELWQSLLKQPELSILVLRNGREQSIQVESTRLASLLQ